MAGTKGTKISVRKSRFRPLPLQLIQAKWQGQEGTEGMDEKTSATRVIMAEI